MLCCCIMLHPYTCLQEFGALSSSLLFHLVLAWIMACLLLFRSWWFLAHLYSIYSLPHCFCVEMRPHLCRQHVTNLSVLGTGWFSLYDDSANAVSIFGKLVCLKTIHLSSIRMTIGIRWVKSHIFRYSQHIIILLWQNINVIHQNCWNNRNTYLCPKTSLVLIPCLCWCWLQQGQSATHVSPAGLADLCGCPGGGARWSRCCPPWWNSMLLRFPACFHHVSTYRTFIVWSQVCWQMLTLILAHKLWIEYLQGAGDCHVEQSVTIPALPGHFFGVVKATYFNTFQREPAAKLDDTPPKW